MKKFKIFASKPETVDALCEAMFENFLDEVFDVSSRVSRDDFMRQITEKSKYLFSPSELR